MPDFTPMLNIQFPLPEDLIRSRQFQSKLAQDLQEMAMSSERAVTTHVGTFRDALEAFDGRLVDVEELDRPTHEMYEMVEQQTQDTAVSRDAAVAAADEAKNAAHLVDAPADLQMAALIEGPEGATHDAIQTKLSSLLDNRLGVPVELFGASGDGTQDDTNAINTALQAAQALRIPDVVLSHRTYSVTGKIIVPAGVKMISHNATISAAPSTDFAVSLTSDSSISGHLTVQTNSDRARGIEIRNEQNVWIESVAVESTVENAGNENGRDNALYVGNSSNIGIGVLRIKNFEHAIRIERSDDLNIGGINIDVYRTGLYLAGVRKMAVGPSRIHGRSIYAQPNAGNNGVLIESTEDIETQDIVFINVTVEDSGEHGFRLGGHHRMSNIKHLTCVSRNVGASGFKSLGSPSGSPAWHENIDYINCLAEDCGDGTDVHEHCGFTIQKTLNATLDTPRVRRSDKQYSAYTGIRLHQARNVSIIEPQIMETKHSGFWIEPGYGNSTNIRLSGGMIESESGDGIVIDVRARTFRRIHIVNHPSIHMNNGHAFVVHNDGGTGDFVGFPFVSLYTTRDEVASGEVNLFACDIVAPMTTPENTPTFAAGSKWFRPGYGQYIVRSGSVWSQL